MQAPVRSEVVLEELTLAVWSWGRPGARPVLLVHGWGDSGATFEAVAAHLGDEFHLIAPDLRGFGESGASGRPYWFPDYLRDLDAVVAASLGDRPFTLVGHSMGGNVAGIYAGVRPERVASLVLLEGFGMPPSRAADAPDRYRRWLDQQDVPPTLRDFADTATLMKHLQRLAPAASPEVLGRVLPRWAGQLPNGAWRLRMDPRHKAVNATLYRREEAAACWRATSAPVVLVAGAESDFAQRFHGLDPMADCAAHYAEASCHVLAGAGHMMHWERPAEVAALVRAAATRVA